MININNLLFSNKYSKLRVGAPTHRGRFHPNCVAPLTYMT